MAREISMATRLAEAGLLYTSSQPVPPHTEATVRCAAWIGGPVKIERIRVAVDEAGVDVLVWDPMAGRYTGCHALSVRTRQRIASKVLGRPVPRGVMVRADY